jgi:integrase
MGYTKRTTERQEASLPKKRICACTITFYGRLRSEDKVPIRKSTDKIEWREAEEVVGRWRAGLPEPPPPAQEPRPENGRTSVGDAGKRFRAVLEEEGMTWASLKQYRALSRRMVKFSEEQKHYAYLDQWTKGDVRQFMELWPGALKSKRNRLTRLRALFAFGEEEGWIEGNPAVSVRRKIRNRAQRTAAKKNLDVAYPYTDKEVQTMLYVCEHEYGKKPITATRPERAKLGTTNCFVRKWSGLDVEDFIVMSVYLGLRIGQVATWDISQMNEQGDVHFRAIKNDEWVDTWCPDWLQARIHARVAKHGPRIFGERLTDRLDAITDPWRDRLKTVWKLCEAHLGPWERKPTHHRFRHTFVRILLENGVPPARVAELIGDTEAMVRKVYSAWCPERQEKIRATLREAFADAPRPAAASGGNVIPFKM